jgi:hypothetical protein
VETGAAMTTIATIATDLAVQRTPIREREPLPELFSPAGAGPRVLEEDVIF